MTLILELETDEAFALNQLLILGSAIGRPPRISDEERIKYIEAKIETCVKIDADVMTRLSKKMSKMTRELIAIGMATAENSEQAALDKKRAEV